MNAMDGMGSIIIGRHGCGHTELGIQGPDGEGAR